MKRSFDGLCDRSTGINQLEGRQLQLYSSHRQLTHEDGLVQTGQDYPQCTRACRSHYKRSSTPPRAPRFNRYRSRLFIHLEILVIALLLPRY